jgi:hypothetical protein
MASARDDKARAAGEAFVLLSQTIEDLTVPEVVTLAPCEGMVAPGPLLRMAVNSRSPSRAMALYRVRAQNIGGLSQRICGWERTKHPTYEVREQRRSYARMRSRGG